MWKRCFVHSGPRWPVLVWNVQYSGLLGYTANDGNHKLLTYEIELFCPINLLSDMADTWDGNEKCLDFEPKWKQSGLI